MPKEFRSLISLEEALSIVFDHLPRARTASVPLSRARGCILAERIVSSIDVPGFSRAAMDGFAVLAKDTLEAREDRPVSLRLAGRVPMGVQPELKVAGGEAAEVSTGSMMPSCADAVVMIEYSQAEEEAVLVRRPVYAGENIQAAGSDISFGETALYPGTAIAARELGVLAALGRTEVPVSTLSVAVASTGNELVAPGQPLPPGRIYDINAYTIASAVQGCGAAVQTFGILPDEKEAMAAALQKMAESSDMVIVSGSTSAGAGDMVYRVLEEAGELIFHGVNLKPGKPTIFGLMGGKPFLGLPGYPTSALSVFSLLGAPAIRAALGAQRREKRAAGRLCCPLRLEGRRQMLAVALSGSLVYPVDKGSGSITTLAGADGIIDIPAGVEYLERGTAVQVELFSGASPAELVIAGENTKLLEDLAGEAGEIRLINCGSLRGRMLLEDGVADIAAVVGGSAPAPEGLAVLAGLDLELGLVYRGGDAPEDLSACRLIGWQRDSALKVLWNKALLDLGLPRPSFVRLARSHSAVAAAVASGRADAGFSERQAAGEAGLGFRPLIHEKMLLLGRAGEDRPDVRSLLSALSRLSAQSSAQASPGKAGA